MINQNGHEMKTKWKNLKKILIRNSLRNPIDEEWSIIVTCGVNNRPSVWKTRYVSYKEKIMQYESSFAMNVKRKCLHTFPVYTPAPINE